MTDTNPQHSSVDDELRRRITQLRRERDAHQMDESDYIDAVMALIEAERVRARLNEADWFIGVREKALESGSYPDHAVIDKHYKELEAQLRKENT